MQSLPVSVQPPCATACINIRGHINNPKYWQLYHCSDTGKYTLIGMGSAALAAAVPYPGMMTQIFCKGQRSIPKNKNVNSCFQSLRMSDDVQQEANHAQ